MARPRTFTDPEIRQAVLMAFWENGYESTSLSALEAATGLGRRSLYNSFGDKRALFLRALDDFSDQAARDNLAPLRAPDAGHEAVGAVLHHLLALAKASDGPRGCLICNTAREPVARDADVAARVQRYFTLIEDGFAHALERAQTAGRLGPHEDPRRLARFFLGVLVSVCVLVRAGTPQATLEDVITEALKRLPQD